MNETKRYSYKEAGRLARLTPNTPIPKVLCDGMVDSYVFFCSWRKRLIYKSSPDGIMYL